MDLVFLSEKLKEDSISYQEEYLRELDSLRAMIRLHNPPIKQMLPIIPFIVQHSNIAPEKAYNILVAGLEIRDPRLRNSILSGLVMMRQKALVSSYELFRMLLLYGNDLKPFHSACREFLDLECLDVLTDWYKKGTEKQKCFCYYFLLNFFSEANDLYSAIPPEKLPELNDIISGALFSKGKLSKMCILYFLNQTDVPFNIARLINGQEYAKRLYKELQEEHFDRDMRILKLRIFVLFKNHFKVKLSCTKTIISMLDLESDDIRELLGCLVASVARDETLSVLQVISDEFMNERSADDVACYGMNVMREIYYKAAGLSSGAVTGCSEGGASDICDPEVREGAVDEDGKFVTEVKEAILSHIERYRGNKNKGIFYAYKTVLKAVLKNEVVARPMNYVRKRTTGEERAEMRKKTSEERKRTIAQENWKNKKNRRGKSKNKKNRLFESRKKKVKRS